MNERTNASLTVGAVTNRRTFDDVKVSLYNWAVVVAQLVERLLPIPEVHSSNPVIGKNLFIYIYIEHLLTVNCVLKR